MFDIILAEIIKLKRSFILILIPLGGLISTLLMLLLYTDKAFLRVGSLYVYGWDYFLDVTTYYDNIICPTFFSIFAGYIFTREYQYKTINTVYTYSFSRLKVFAAKMLLILSMMVATFLCSILFTILFGMLLTKDPIATETLFNFLIIHMKSAMINFLIIPMAVFVGMISKNVIAPIVLGIIEILCYAVLNQPFSGYVPGCIPSIFANNFMAHLGANHPVMTYFATYYNMTAAYHTLIVVSVVSFVACVIYFRFSDVK